MNDVAAIDRLHTPVLLSEVVQYLRCPLEGAEFPLVVDGTIGGGGHSEAILEMNSKVFLIGLDRDQEAVNRSARRLVRFKNRILLKEGNYADLPSILQSVWPEIISKRPGMSSEQIALDGILLDLGLSSFQLADPDRGFSFRHSASLDMRYSKKQSLTAEQVLNNYSEQELTMTLRQGGVRKGALNLSREIIRQRPLQTTADLTAICERVYRGQGAKMGAHPATVVYQAVRIVVNDELGSLKRFLDTATALLAPKGRLAIISFQSLEDEVVTRTMRFWAVGQALPPKLPVGEKQGKVGKLLTKHAIVPGAKEIADNPRARSARLRVFERTANSAEVIQ